jgi:hypothetical protein
VNDEERVRWARALTMVGWMFLLAYLGIVTFLVRRAAAIREASFEDGVWWQRVEQVSFATLPQNLVVLVPAAAAAVVGALVVRAVVDRSVIWLGQLVRVIAGVAMMVVVIAVTGIVGVFFREADNVADLQALLQRIGGIMMAAAMIRLCLEVERRG